MFKWLTQRSEASSSKSPAAGLRNSAVFRDIPAPAAPSRMGSRQSAVSKRNINIGLDFGTSATKVVVRIDDPAGPQYVAVGPSDQTDTLVYPAVVRLERDTLYFGHDAERRVGGAVVRSFKMNLPAEISPLALGQGMRFSLGASGLSASEASTLYVAWVLADVLKQIRQWLAPAELQISINAAAPLDQLDEQKDLKTLFHRIFIHALRLAGKAHNGWMLPEARNALALARVMPLPSEAESPVNVFPETHAAMTSYLLMPARQRGLFATVDIGAGSTDVAFFWFHATDGLPEMCYWGCASSFVGMDDVDDAIGKYLNVDRVRARQFRESGEVNFSDVPGLTEVFQRIHGSYKRAFQRSYARVPGNREWSDDGHARYLLCLVGGGSLCKPLGDHLQRRSPFAGYITSTDMDRLRVPGTLTALRNQQRVSMQSIAAGEQPLFLLACGLARRAIEIPICDMDQPMLPVREYVEHPTHEELYG